MGIILFFMFVFHGLIHFIGFVRAFHFGNIAKFTDETPKLMGLLWILTGLLFITSAILYTLKKDAWPVLAIIAVIISQILILFFWQDAKFGTIVNVIILSFSLSAYGDYQFNKMVLRETKELVRQTRPDNTSIMTKDAIEQLPEIVQKWMNNSGAIGKEKMVSVHLKQKGEMKIKPKGKWMPFTAEQYFDILDPAFVWSTEVDFMPMVKMVGRDKFIDGKGEMLIKLAALIPVADEGNNEKINSATMLRYMAEMIWFPSAALSDYIRWETVNKHSAKATFSLYGKTVSGIFKFSDNGEIIAFEAQRYYSTDKDATLETWLVQTEEYKNFNGFRMPSKSKVTWKLKEGDFNWLNFEITDWEYNKPPHF